MREGFLCAILTNMNIAKGIVGIKSIKSNNTTGWHIIINDRYMGYVSNTFLDAVELYSWMGNTLIDVNCSTLVFTNANRI